MKQYLSPNQLRLVGKGREIRRQLRQLAAAAPRELLLSQFTSQIPPMHVKLGGIRSVKVRSVTSGPQPAE